MREEGRHGAPRASRDAARVDEAFVRIQTVAPRGRGGRPRTTSGSAIGRRACCSRSGTCSSTSGAAPHPRAGRSATAPWGPTSARREPPRHALTGSPGRFRALSVPKATLLCSTHVSFFPLTHGARRVGHGGAPATSLEVQCRTPSLLRPPLRDPGRQGGPGPEVLLLVPIQFSQPHSVVSEAWSSPSSGSRSPY